jgi:hypothetical protein
MHDIDDHIQDLLRSVAPAPLLGDRRAAIRAGVRRRLLRRHAGAVAVAVVGCLAVVALSTYSSGDQTITAGPPAADAPAREHEVRVPGLAPIRVSNTAQPVAGYRSFGAVPLGGGAITGAVETTRADGTVVAVVAVTAGPMTQAVDVRGSNGETATGTVADGVALTVLVLERRDPFLVLAVEALDASATKIAGARVTPYIQEPVACATNPQIVGHRDEMGAPSHIAHLDAFLTAPLPASCTP